jgi:2-polyprenyl-3-methyl-5-hydroxy-6-metoxy-1,4-benzoquinol methylase
MNTFREKLIEQYATHYARWNGTAEPNAIAAPLHGHLDLMYRPLIGTLPHAARVLDLGCGTGYLLSWLSRTSHLRLTGVDSSTSQTDVARSSLAGVDVRCEDGLSFLREHPDHFHAIFCLDVLEHIPSGELQQLLEAVRAALIPGGFFVCKVPNAANLIAAHLRYIDLTHERSFTFSSLIQVLESVSLSEVAVVPVRVPHLSGRMRLLIERSLHRLLFRVCGDTDERVFTSTISVVSYRR